MLVKIGDTYEPVFKIEDLERFMDKEVYDAVEALTNESVEKAMEEVEEHKEMSEVHERISDERYQIITKGIVALTSVCDELESLQRFNRKQLVGKLKDIINELENY